MKPKEKNLKGLIHAVLAGLAVLELASADTKTRKFFLGTAAGWHCHAAFYHFVLEKK